MANQHSKNTQAVTYRLDPALVAAVRETAARLGEDQKALVARALRAELARQENPMVAGQPPLPDVNTPAVRQAIAAVVGDPQACGEIFAILDRASAGLETGPAPQSRDGEAASAAAAAAPAVWWDGCQIYAARPSGRYEAVFVHSDGYWYYQGDVGELPADAVRLVPDTGQGEATKIDWPAACEQSTCRHCGEEIDFNEEEGEWWSDGDDVCGTDLDRDHEPLAADSSPGGAVGSYAQGWHDATEQARQAIARRVSSAGDSSKEDQ